MYRILLLICLAVIGLCSLPEQAVGQTPSPFYPLATFARGDVLVAQRLFLGDEGGIWIHDIQGRVLFFDGQTILPKQGSILKKAYSQLAYAQGAFWSFIDNELFRTYPGAESESVLSLALGGQIQRIGASNGYIWLTDNIYFYTYHLVTGEQQSFSLTKLYQFNQTSQVIINDAKRVHNQWFLATNAGTYLLNNKQFSHIASSGKNAVEQLLFSPQHNHLLMGTSRGALIINIEQPESVITKIGHSAVLSMTEIGNGYWIGTENGVLIYSLATDEVGVLEGDKPSIYGIPEGKIYALLNDQQGGVWLATQQGIRYFSLFSQRVTRYAHREAIENLQPLAGTDDYLMTTSEGLSLLSFQPEKRVSTKIYAGQVNDVQQIGNTLWIATTQGLRRYVLQSAPSASSSVPFALRHVEIEYLTADHQGRLWGFSSGQLWSYHPQQNHYTEWGQDGFPLIRRASRITWLYASDKYGLLIGSEHGIYRLSDNKMTYYQESARYGSSMQVIESPEGKLWFLSEFGFFRFDSANQQMSPLPLIADNVRLNCLLQTSQGLWLASSQGITLYDFDGAINKHIGEPYGVINNELSSGSCAASGVMGKETLLFSSSLSLLHMEAEELARAELPPTSMVLSQVSINQLPVHIGGLTQQALRVDYGKGISFQFGIAPLVASPRFEFRLDNDSWQSFSGAQLALAPLSPGHYYLSLRSQEMPQQVSTWTFQVLKPWYFSSLAFMGYLLIVVTLIVMFIQWRSRLMSRMNVELYQQKPIETYQSQHDMLLNRNQQLCKQKSIRQIGFEHWWVNSQSLLKTISDKTAQNKQDDLHKLIQQMVSQVQQVRIFSEGEHPHSIVYPLDLVLDAVLEGWRSEFAAGKVNIVYDSFAYTSERFVKQTGLESIFNVIMADALQRLYPHQTLMINCSQREGNIVVTMTDEGKSVDQLGQLLVISNENRFISLYDAVTLAGGELRYFSSSERNLVELMWPACSLELQETSCDFGADISELCWLTKLEEIIATHYADPEFSTLSAAQQMYVSERSFQRRFKQVTSKTFKEFLTEYRLQQARDLLMKGEKVSEVAFQCGFNDPSYFSQRFKLHFGLSPSQFIADNSQ